MLARALELDPNLVQAQKLSGYIAQRRRVLAEHPAMPPGHPGMPDPSPPSAVPVHPQPDAAGGSR